ncbi:MAG: hypothetical protein GWP56_02465 [Gammaproteobacteria bacterium]|jgi:hypothetical protein|nr:hypothetical protein [Gammaproteobacteria bacterium]
MQRFIAILFCLLVTEPAFAATSVQDLQQLISQQRYATATPNGEQVMQLLSTWLADWESLDHERYRRRVQQAQHIQLPRRRKPDADAVRAKLPQQQPERRFAERALPAQYRGELAHRLRG